MNHSTLILFFTSTKTLKASKAGHRFFAVSSVRGIFIMTLYVCKWLHIAARRLRDYAGLGIARLKQHGGASGRWDQSVFATNANRTSAPAWFLFVSAGGGWILDRYGCGLIPILKNYFFWGILDCKLRDMNKRKFVKKKL